MRAVFPATRKHGFRGGSAAGGELGSEADAPCDPAGDAGRPSRGGEAAGKGFA